LEKRYLGLRRNELREIQAYQYYYIIIFARETNPMLAHSERKSDPGKQAFPDPRGVAWLAFLSLATCVPQNTVEFPHNVFPRKELYYIHCCRVWALQIQWGLYIMLLPSFKYHFDIFRSVKNLEWTSLAVAKVGL
jgi:hypothetical protein